MDVAEIITKLDSAGFEDTDEADKLDVINDTLWDIDSRALWPYLEKTIALNFDGSSPTATNMPTNFKAAIWLHDTTNGMTIWPERLSTVRDRHGAQISQVSDPVLYYFLGDSLRLWPVPPATTGRFQLDYFAQQPELAADDLEADILLPKRHHRAILLGALWRLYEVEDDPEQGSVFNQRYELRIAQMLADLNVRQHQRADQIFVIDEDDEYWM
jgi:hypothetical protein